LSSHASFCRKAYGISPATRLGAMALMLLVLLICAAQTANAASGATTGGFADLEPGGHGAALGGALAPLVDDPSALYWNPARLTNILEGGVSASYADLYGLDLVQHTGMFIAFPKYPASPSWKEGAVMDRTSLPFMTWAVGYQSTKVDLDPESYTESDITLGVGRRGKWGFTYGMAAHYYIVGSDLVLEDEDAEISEDVSASGYGFDIAVARPLNPDFDGTLVFKSLFSSVKWQQSGTESLSPRAQIGVGWHRIENLAVPCVATYDLDQNRLTQFAVGAEWLPIGEALTVRAGLRWRDDGISSRILPAAGLGVTLGQISFDYGFSIGREELGETHRLGLRFRFS
jgi:hypothetical protein